MAKLQLEKIAQILYLNGESQKDIAVKLGVTEKTVGSWKKKHNWEHKKDNILMSRENRLSELHEELAEFNRMIKEKKDYKVATSREADARRKLLKDIKELETKYNVAELISICRDMAIFFKEIDYEFALQFTEAADGFINHTIDKQKWQS